MIKIDFLPLSDVYDDVVAYVEENKDIMVDYAGHKLNVDYRAYKDAAEDGQVLVLLLRDDNKIVGFSLWAVGRDMRDMAKFEASNHGLFVEKQYREKYGKRMIEDSKKFLNRLGIFKTSYTNDSEVFGRILESMGYAVEFKIWSLEDGK